MADTSASAPDAASPHVAAASSPAGGKKAAAQKKAKGASGARSKPTHPPTSEMVESAIKSLKERGGSSLQAIKKYVAANYKVDAEKLSPFIKKYLKTAVVSGALVQTKGKGASGSFKLAAGGTAAKSPSGGDSKTTAQVKRPTKTAAKTKKPKATAAAKKQRPSAGARKSPKVKKPIAPAAAAAAADKKPKSPSRTKKTTKVPTKKPKAPKPKKTKTAAGTPSKTGAGARKTPKKK